MWTRAWTLLIVAVCLVSFAPVQKPKSDVCPWCKNDPDTMKKAGVVTHGSMPIGPWTSAELPAKLPAGQWIALLYHAVRADLYARLGRRDEAEAAYDAAIGLVTNAAEREHLERKRRELR